MSFGGDTAAGGELLVALAVFVAVLGATACALHLARRFRVLALPNARSSHRRPTPSAGGIGIALPVLGYLGYAVSGYPPALALLLAGASMAALGAIDDVRDLRRELRLAVHAAVCGACVVALAPDGALLGAALVVGLVWWVNLYNFMDGIDGIAALQAFAYAVGILLIGDLDASAAFAKVLAAAALGFLCFNWAPAKIFMGDAGSGFLGIATGVLALWLWRNGELAIVPSAILLLGFWADASYTLLVRVVTGQAFMEAHRSHLYQKLAGRLGHGRTTALFGLHALLWLMPLAALAAAFPPWQFAFLALAAVPIVLACRTLRAGADAP